MIKRSSSFLRSCWEKIKRVSPRLAFKRILFYESATEYYCYEVGEKTAQNQRERDDDVFTRGCRGTKTRFEDDDDSEEDDDDEKKSRDSYHEK